MIKLLIGTLTILCSLNCKAQNFTVAEQALIVSGDTSKLLRLIPLAEPEGKKYLRKISLDITCNDPLLPLLKERM